MQRPRRTALAGLALAVLLLVAAAVLLRFVAPDVSAPVPATPTSPAAAPAPPGAPAPPARPPAGLPFRVAPALANATPDSGPGSFEGRVVSSRTGAGIPDADLTFSRAGAAALARTGPDGAFRFVPPADGSWLLAA